MAAVCAPVDAVAPAVKQKTCLIVIDGWGVSSNHNGNAVFHANTPVMDAFEADHNWTLLDAHGVAVGLPRGLMGNSEVGHMNIGAGRVCYQDICRIEVSIERDQIKSNENLVASFANAKATTGRLHLLGLVSDGGVHSHISHLKEIIRLAKAAGVPETFVHFIADGRDTRPKSAVEYLQDLLTFLAEQQYGRVASVVGRYYAMDRDKRYERVQLAFDAYTQGKGEAVPHADLLACIAKHYEADVTDEFLKPIVVSDVKGTIADHDTLLFFNYRSDRMREIVTSFGIAPQFEGAVLPSGLHITTMTVYKDDFAFPALFPPQNFDNVLAEWLGKKHVHQYHVAETEKYAHVTFFFNGGQEKQFENEERTVVPSPKVATYDLQPAMNSTGVADTVVAGLDTGKYDFVMCNFAPPDMVGHTGVYDAAVRAVESTDAAIGVIWAACQRLGYVLFVTADHGNAEQMISEQGGPHTAHTCNQVPFAMSNNAAVKFKVELAGAALCDVAPTVLAIMGLDVPVEMDGRSLV